MKYILGVDGGGTKTEAIAYDLDGNILSKGYSKFGNILINRESALSNIKEAIDKCTIQIIDDECIYMYLGIAGSEAGNGKEIIKDYVEEIFKCNATVVNDGDLALSALLNGQDGFLTVAGTGSVCIGKYLGEKVRAGGWGHLLGDEGSGYYIAIEALKKITLERDSAIERSNFTKEILKGLKCDNEFDIINFVYNSEKAEIAKIVPIIVELAKNNDKAAIEILSEAGRALGKITLAAIKQLNIKGKIKVGITGSVLTKIHLVKINFIEFLNNNLNDFTLYDENVSSTKGAYYEVLKLIEK